MTKDLPAPFRLDARLACIAAEIPACDLAADIGADHGKLSCWLLVSGRVKRMIVSDISKTSRDKARDLFVEHQVLDRVDFSGDDGLNAIHGEPQAVIIAGMGGGLIHDILQQDVSLRGARLVLSAHTELPLVREALQAKKYRIEQETLVQSGGRYYRVLTAVPGQMLLNDRQRMMGINVKACCGTSLIEYYQWQMKVAASWRGEKGNRYREYLEEELASHESKHSTSNP